jgi:hypothetical protein
VNAEQQLAESIMRFQRDPLNHVRFAYPWGEDGELAGYPGPHGWQSEILDTIGKHLRSPYRFTPLQIAVASGHGIGKSALIGWVMHWAMSTCVDTRITVTAGTGKQIETKTWPEVTKWFKLPINSHWFECKAESIHAKDKQHERTWRADVNTWSQGNPGAFAGLHNAGKRIVIVYDESSTIDDVVWEVTSGALTDERTEIIWLAFGNPTENTGRFRECFGRFKHRWITKQIDSRTVPGTNKELFDEWVHDYGEDSDYVRVRVRGEFPRAGSTQLIGGDVVAGARSRKLPLDQYSRYWKILSVDVARFGDDQTVTGLRQGPKLNILSQLRGQSVIQTGQRVIEDICETRPRCCVIDGDGVGGGVVDYVREYLPGVWFKRFGIKLPETFHLQEFHGGFNAFDPYMYFNLRAESWGKCKKWLETADIPDLPELEMDLTGVQYRFSGQNQIQLERKEDMKKRGLASPNLGDMLAMSFSAMPAGMTEEEQLGEKLSKIEDPFWRTMEQLRATMDKEQAEVVDARPAWMRDGG